MTVDHQYQHMHVGKVTQNGKFTWHGDCRLDVGPWGSEDKGRRGEGEGEGILLQDRQRGLLYRKLTSPGRQDSVAWLKEGKSFPSSPIPLVYLPRMLIQILTNPSSCVGLSKVDPTPSLSVVIMHICACMSLCVHVSIACVHACMHVYTAISVTGDGTQRLASSIFLNRSLPYLWDSFSLNLKLINSASRSSQWA